MAENASSSRRRILVADDQTDVLKALRMLLDDAGYAVDTVSRPDDAVERLQQNRYDLLLMDLNYTRDTTSGEEGLRAARPRPRDRRVAAGRRHDRLRQRRRRRAGHAGRRARLRREALGQLPACSTSCGPSSTWRGPGITNARSRPRCAGLRGADEDGVIAESQAMRDVLELVRRVGPSDATVLITGENGVGKGVMASVLHRLSDRADKPLLTVDLGTLSGGLVEAELFGHEAGAFTDAKGQARRPLRAGRRGHAVPGRDRQLPAGPAVATAARHRNRRVRAAGLVADAPTPTCG